MSEPRHRWLAAAWRVHLHSWRMKVWLALLTVASLVLSTIPLLGILGFGFAFVLALMASIAALDLGAALVRQTRQAPAHALDQGRSALGLTFSLWVRAAGAALLTLVLPIAVISLNALRVRNCDFGFGMRATLAMPVLSVIYASGVGVGLGLLAGRRRASAFLPYGFVILAVIASTWSFYAAPPVFFYNPLIGYFPGNLYDEFITFGGAFAWARVFHFATLMAALSMLAAAIDIPSLALAWRRRRPTGRRWPALVTASVSCLAAVVIWSNAASFGFAIGEDDIRAALGGHRRTENFDIYYPKNGPVAERVDELADDHEFRFAQVVRDLGARPEGRITSYYFQDEDDKHRWMGARRVHMAKPWRREIYVNDQTFPHQIIRHEIAHAVASAFGSAIFKVSADTVLGLPVLFNPGMIEGLAVAADWPNHFRQALTPHESVKAMYELGLAPPVTRILSSGFFAYSGARSYTTAGSFLRYLLETHGAAKLRALYRSGGDFDAVFGQPQEMLVAQWNQMIQAIELAPGRPP